MNKARFFTQLRASLSGLAPEEREDILRDLEEHFYEASKRGLSDEAIIRKLGSPKKIAETIIAEAKINRISTAKTVPQKTNALLAALVAIVVLAPYSIFIIVIPFMLILFLLCSLWPLGLALAGTLPLVLLALLLMMFQVSFSFIAILCLLFFALGWSSMVLAVVLGLTIFTVLMFKGLARLFHRQLHFVKRKIRN